MRRKSPKKHVVFRCREELACLIDLVCAQHHLTRTRLVNGVLTAYAAKLGCNGELPTYPEYQIQPPPRRPRNYYL